MKLPKLRTENLIEQNLRNETLIYDLITNQAFNLNETSTIIYQACNSGILFDELKRRHKFSDDFIYLALDELKSHNLLAEGGTAYQSPFSGINRRDVIKKVGFASMFVLPIIAGIVAPTAAQAASGVMGSSGSPGSSGTPDFVGLGNACLGGRDTCGTLSSAPCVSTTYSGDRCCFSNATPRNHILLISGETYTTPTDEFPSVLPLDYPTSDTTTCASQASCCSSDLPAVGTCTRTLITVPDDYYISQSDLDSLAGSGYGYFFQNCSCTCP